MNLTQQRILVFVGLALLLAGGGWWLATRERQVVLERELPKALSSDPWAGSKEFLRSMGLRTDETTRLDDILDKARDHDVVVLDLQGPPPDEVQLRRLGYWVQGGGRLIVEADASDLVVRCVLPEWGMRRDTSRRASEDESCPEGLERAWRDRSPSMKSESVHHPADHDSGTFAGGVAIRTSEDSSEAADADEMDEDDADSEVDTVAVESDVPVPPSILGEDFAWRTVRRRLLDTTDAWDSISSLGANLGIPIYHVGTPAFDSLAWDGRQPRKAFADPGGFVLIGSLGRGSMVVVTGFHPFLRQGVSEHDHASLLWRMVGPGLYPRTVWIAKQARLEGWIAMLAARVPVALGLGIFALVLAMWAAASRFGPLLASPDEEKTGIVHHAEGAGRWLWQFPGGRLKLLAALRDSARRQQLRTHPELVGADSRTLGKALEAEGLGSAAALEEAFSESDDTSPKHFLSVAKTLWSLRRNR